MSRPNLGRATVDGAVRRPGSPHPAAVRADALTTVPVRSPDAARRTLVVVDVAAPIVSLARPAIAAGAAASRRCGAHRGFGRFGAGRRHPGCRPVLTPPYRGSCTFGGPAPDVRVTVSRTPGVVALRSAASPTRWRLRARPFACRSAWRCGGVRRPWASAFSSRPCRLRGARSNGRIRTSVGCDGFGHIAHLVPRSSHWPRRVCGPRPTATIGIRSAGANRRIRSGCRAGVGGQEPNSSSNTVDQEDDLA